MRVRNPVLSNGSPPPAVLNRIGIAVASILAVAAPRGPALAAAGQSDQLEEVIITARKRVENLQDVPISVNVRSAFRNVFSPVWFPATVVTPASSSTGEARASMMATMSS